MVLSLTGLEVHFIHVKPPQLSSRQKVRPLLMVHGWPGSIYEFYKIIPLLTDPGKHGLDPNVVFEVICPSIPGYGFSEASHKKGERWGRGSWEQWIMHRFWHDLRVISVYLSFLVICYLFGKSTCTYCLKIQQEVKKRSLQSERKSF